MRCISPSQMLSVHPHEAILRGADMHLYYGGLRTGLRNILATATVHTDAVSPSSECGRRVKSSGKKHSCATRSVCQQIRKFCRVSWWDQIPLQNQGGELRREQATFCCGGSVPARRCAEGSVSLGGL
ncbi:hypothetical protein SKAU_G00065170 [Synaphobranchus kaupii]|uniref:Uncharacterized protein n=1 Tax=Synaphobranchus kaupii TaxID=118154 RepID=A0A9Q1G5Q2_SYNKA|nr:hypothetical protein SKAU_G00065170 [Synaphobranchus kaupii]